MNIKEKKTRGKIIFFYMTSKPPRKPWFWEGGKQLAKQKVLTSRKSILNGDIESARCALFFESHHGFFRRNFGGRKNPCGSWARNMQKGSTEDWWHYYRWKYGIEQLSIQLLESNGISTIHEPNWYEIYKTLLSNN